jgi:hypothetical protein
MLKIPVRIGHFDIPSTKGIIKDQKLLVAYALASTNSEIGGKQNRQSSNNASEGFVAVIKNFFKQLMP